MNKPEQQEQQPTDLELFSACCCAMIDIHNENQEELVTQNELIVDELEY